MPFENSKQQRGTLKSKLTRFRNFIENPENNTHYQEIRERLNKFEPLDLQYEEIQDEIERSIESTNLDALAAETVERDSFENEYYRLIALAKTLLANAESSTQDNNRENSTSVEIVQHTTNRSMLRQLPAISVPKFDGNLSKWINFRDSFNSLVNTQSALSKIDKFNYLSHALEGEAARAIQSLGISEANYEYAWKKLQDRYENSEELIEHHTQALCELSPMTKNSGTDLRRLIDDAQNHLAALKSLGESTGKCNSLLIYLLSKKLDDETQKLWNRHTLENNGKRSFVDFITVLEGHCKYLQKMSIGKQSNAIIINKGQSNNKKANERVMSYSTTANSCPDCYENHAVYSCPKFKSRDVQARIARVKELKLCFNCLRPGHQGKSCSSGPCKKCNRYHNTLLHITKSNNEEKQLSTENSSVVAQTSLTAQASDSTLSHVLLGTAIVQVYDREGNTHECRALLDSGSQIHFMTQECFNRLKLAKSQAGTTVSGIQQATINLKHKTVVKLQSRTTGFKTTITCLITPKITDNIPNININRQAIKIPNGIELADPLFDDSRSIDMLKGAGLFWDLLCVGQIKTSKDQPFLQKTKLGWIVTGGMQYQSTQPQNKVSCHMITNTQLHAQVEKFWALEECTKRSGAPPLDLSDPCEQHFVSTINQNSSNRFIVTLPFNEKKEQLGQSYNIAYKRLLAMEKKFISSPTLQKEYIKFMHEYEELGHMSRLSKQKCTEEKGIFYLRHHAVFKEQSTTTKLRVVFDGSAKTTLGLSLNDVQHAGYEVQDELFCILLRFRKHKYIITADAAKMYRQILVREEDRSYQRILWRSDANQPIQIYELNTVTYGTRAGAFLAKRCLRQIGEENSNTYPEASQIIINDFYVDDLLTGADSIEITRRLKNEVAQLLLTRGFTLRKWASNEPLVLEDNTINDLIIQATKDPKTLGLKWMTTADELIITINPQKDKKISKRTILSQIAQIFDPLGIIAPITLHAKIILQHVWQLKLDWDESLPQELHTVWQKFQQHLIHLHKIQIPRRAIVDHIRLELHGFSDASEAAYGACICLRSLDEYNIHTTHLLCAKSRVAPLKKVSLPRLELCAAVLLAQLADKVSKALMIKIDDQYFWSDSMITLSWIKSQANRWKTFVANRVGEIQRLTNNNWSHVISEENPADLVSRGSDPMQLSNSTLWWHGPSWLSQEASTWPGREISVDDKLPEERNVQIVAVANVTSSFDLFLNFSSWTHLTRVVAYCLRFAFITRNKSKGSTTARLTTAELYQSQLCIIRAAQRECFQAELKSLHTLKHVEKSSRLASLNPFIDKNGIIRVGGRLQKAPIKFDQMHPIILPANHKLSWLIIAHEHNRLLHAGCQSVISSLRMRYWPLSVKAMVRKVVKKCVKCIRLQATTTKYIMGNLPSTRVTPTRPFYVSGVDYAGPIYLKEKTRNRTIIKAYICIFICFATKAVHIELAHDLSTEAFLNCLRRFVSHRGRCQKLYSDNGLNFVGARNQLNELGCLLQNKKFQANVESYTMNEQIAWHLNPTYAPHFGGLWKSAVKSVKFHFKRVIGEIKLTYEEMYTILTQIEACLNSRPLSPMSDDPNDLTPLTPAHFLAGESLMALPESDVREIPINRLGRYQHLQYMVQHFWQRWRREYLHGLQQRSKWKHDITAQLELGSMVIIKDDNLPPTRWRLGRIVKLHPGADKITRVVSIKTADGIITRPVVKVVPLSITSEEDQLDKKANCN